MARTWSMIPLTPMFSGGERNYVTSIKWEECCDKVSPGAVGALRKQLGGRCQGRCPQGDDASAKSWRMDRSQPCKGR